MGFATRTSTSNEISDNSNAANPWSRGNEFYDAVCRLLNGMAHRCKFCKRITHIDFLQNDKCPDCRG